MFKLLNFVFLLVILCGGLHSINGEALQCNFGDVNYFGNLYSCSVTALENPNDDKIITGYNGNHQSNKYYTDVKQIYISELDTKFIPEGLGSVFNITALVIRKSKLKEIRSKDFQGMQNLEYLSLYDNKFISVPSDTFSTIPKLKQIQWHSNQIKYIGSGAFDQLKNLNDLYLNNNVCVNKDYNGASEINQMKNEIKTNCEKPNDTIQYEIENKISDESSKNREEIKALNKMMKQLLNESKEHQIERQENIKQRSELSLAKEEQKKEQVAKEELMNENADLKKELTEAKKTIEEKLPKMEQTINEFHMEVMDQKIERHHQRELYREIRSKLMKCEKEKLEF